MAKDIAQEAREEVREADTPGTRGKEYRDRERVGDEGQPYRRGGHVERARGGFMPEETEASEGERGQRGERPEKAEREPAKREGEESYADERKRGGSVKRRARGGRLDAAEEHKAPHNPKHHPRKKGGKAMGKKPASRPDRRARGGGADLHPETAAGNMSVPDYERQRPIKNGGGRGRD